MARRGKLTKEERNLVRNYRVFIIDGGNKNKSFSICNERKQNSHGNGILDTYCNDLGFPRPRYFSIRNWMERGIHVHLYETKWKAYRHLRAMSLMRKRRVFVLWGKRAHRLINAIEPDMGHLIILGGYPGTGRRLKYFNKTKPFSTIADWLGVTREIWRL